MPIPSSIINEPPCGAVAGLRREKGTGRERYCWRIRSPVGIGILLVTIGVGVMVPIPVMVMTVMPLRGVRIIIASSEADSGIAAAAGDQEAETAEDRSARRIMECAPLRCAAGDIFVSLRLGSL
jgi:hypothetical protein